MEREMKEEDVRRSVEGSRRGRRERGVAGRIGGSVVSLLVLNEARGKRQGKGAGAAVGGMLRYANKYAGPYWGDALPLAAAGWRCGMHPAVAGHVLMADQVFEVDLDRRIVWERGSRAGRNLGPADVPEGAILWMGDYEASLGWGGVEPSTAVAAELARKCLEGSAPTFHALLFSPISDPPPCCPSLGNSPGLHLGLTRFARLRRLVLGWDPRQGAWRPGGPTAMTVH